MGKYHRLDAIIKENGKIEGYILYNFFAGFHEYWTLENTRKHINTIEDGFIDARGYLRIKGKKMSDFDVKSIKDLDSYHCLV